MLRELTEEKDLDHLLRYLKKDIANCLYLYIDLWRYGLRNENIRVWIGENGGPVIMKYHDSFQLYTEEGGLREERERTELVNLLKTHAASRIFGRESLIRQLEPLLSGGYNACYGVVFCKKRGSAAAPRSSSVVEFAKMEDLPQIADLLMSSAEFSAHYRKSELLAQLRERLTTKMGRSMILRDGPRIAGHIATFAEAEGIAVMSGSLVPREYRNTDCFEILTEQFDYLLCNTEQRDVYSFVTDKRQIRLAKKMKKPCASYGKLSKIGLRG